MRLAAFLIALAATAGLFLAFPQIDIATSRLLFREGEGFFLSHWAPVSLLYDYVGVITWSVVAAFIGWLVARALGPLRRLHVRASAMIYIALSLAIGPGLISNAILKEHMGRARPAQVVEFGGTKRFTPALVPSDQCRKNCSFVSGHAAAGFFLVTLAFLVTPGPWRRAAFAGALGIGAAFSAARIAEGRHFLSDTVFAGFISFVVAWALYALIGARDSPGDRLIQRWEARLHARERPGALIVSQAHALGAVLALCIVSYIFIDRPALKWFRTFDWNLHLSLAWIADWGRQVFWIVPAGLALIALWLAARHPRLKAQAERLKAWSIVALFIFVAQAFSGPIGWIMKFVFGRMRPLYYYRHHEYGFTWFGLDASLQSFPSGHSVTVATAMATFCFLWPRYAAAWIALGATLIVARVMETAHFVSDALFGTYIGIVLTAYVWGVFERSGVDFAAAKAGRVEMGERLPWAERLALPAWLTRMIAPAAAKERKPVPADPS